MMTSDEGIRSSSQGGRGTQGQEMSKFHFDSREFKFEVQQNFV